MIDFTVSVDENDEMVFEDLVIVVEKFFRMYPDGEITNSENGVMLYKETDKLYGAQGSMYDGPAYTSSIFEATRMLLGKEEEE